VRLVREDAATLIAAIIPLTSAMAATAIVASTLLGAAGRRIIAERPSRIWA
jgi:hypothetical protein